MLPLPDVQAILDRGKAAGFVLDHPLFADAMNDIANFHMSAILATPEGPDGTAVRDHHHRMIRASQELVDTFQGYRLAGDEAQAASDALDLDKKEPA